MGGRLGGARPRRHWRLRAGGFARRSGRGTAAVSAAARWRRALAELWDRKSVSCVQITMAEDFGVEGRGRFYTPSAR